MVRGFAPYGLRVQRRSREGVKNKNALEKSPLHQDEGEVSVVRRLSDLEPMAPTMRMLAIDADLLALARGDDTVLDESCVPVAEPDPFGGLEPVFEDSCPSLHEEEEEVTRIGLHVVPVLAIPEEELSTLPLDHRHGFLLCRIDGTRSLSEIVELTGLSAIKVRAMAEVLLALGVIELR